VHSQIGLDEKCCRMQLEVLSWNDGAINFYERHGGINYTALEGWHDFEFTKNVCHDSAKK